LFLQEGRLFYQDEKCGVFKKITNIFNVELNNS